MSSQKKISILYIIILTTFLHKIHSEKYRSEKVVAFLIGKNLNKKWGFGKRQ